MEPAFKLLQDEHNVNRFTAQASLRRIPGLCNPLAQLSADEIRGLWGVYLDAWSDDIAQKLRGLDPQRACVCISDGAAVPPGKSLPPLPSGLRYLCVDSRASDGLDRLAALTPLAELRFLRVHLVSRATADLAVLKNARRLRRLELDVARVTGLKHLAQLGNLRFLDVSACPGVADVGFVRGLTRLRSLDVSRTEVEDLSPLAEHAALERVDASGSPVRLLPPGIVPKLTSLHVMSTRLSDEQVATFQQAHPQCTVRHRWTAAFRQAVREADRLRVRSGGTCHRDPGQEQTLFESSDPALVAALVAGIEIDEARSRSHCMCCGEPSLEFYRGPQLLVTLGFHHGRSLRWPDGWLADGLLTDGSATFLRTWLAEHNVEGPARQYEAALEQERARERKVARMGQGLSDTLRQALTGGPQRFGPALKREVPDAANQVTILLRLLGTSNDSWTSLDDLDGTPDALLREYELQVLAQAVERGLTGNDRRVRRGAARFWDSYQSPLEDWRPTDPGRLFSVVLAVQREARYWGTRVQGLQSLAAWHAALPPKEVDTLLAAGLCDPERQVRRQAMLTAGRIEHRASSEPLLK